MLAATRLADKILRDLGGSSNLRRNDQVRLRYRSRLVFITSQGLSSVEQDNSCDQLDSAKEISSEFVIARGDSPVVLNFVEETLDEIALAVEREIAVALGLGLGESVE